MTAAAEQQLKECLDRVRTLGPQITAAAERFDAERRMPREIVDAMVHARLFRIFLPRSLDGDELPLAAGLRLFEELGRYDGSAGWTVMIGASSGLSCCYLEEPAAREIFGDPSSVVGGVLNPKGQAVPVNGGYRVTGRWQFGSGCLHSTWLLGNSLVVDGDSPRAGADGQPQMVVSFFPAGDFEVIDTWHVSGLRGTGSHDFAVNDVFVPTAHTYAPLTDRPRLDRALYHFPVFSVLGLSVAAVGLGIARHAIDALVELAASKVPMGGRAVLRDRAMTQVQVAQAEALLRSARAFFYDAAADAWDTVAAGERPSMEQRAQLRLAAAHAAGACSSAVDLAYGVGGGTSIFESAPLERCFRDIHALTQHASVGQSNYETTGRVVLGLDPRAAMF